MLVKNNIKNIDFLTIDVEGHEIDVLKGFDIKKYSPNLVVIEFLDLKMKFDQPVLKINYGIF